MRVECRSGPNWPLRNAIVALYNFARCETKPRTESQNNDLRRYFVIASLRCCSL